MTKTAVEGMQFGDEGKAKVIDYFLITRDYDVVARYHGGGNAGHTQVDKHGKEIITHIIPSGIRKKSVYNAILSGVMVDPLGAVKEIKELREMGYKVNISNLGISERAQITLQYHKDFEKRQERKKGKKAVGTTMKGISPTAVSTYAREGLRFAEFVNPYYFEKFLESLPKSYKNFPEKLISMFRKSGNVVANGANVREYMEMYEHAMNFLRPFKIDEAEFLERMKNKNWLYESAQGALLDVVLGTVPYVTSSETCNPPADTDGIIGVSKAYITRVGGGNLPTRMELEEEKIIRGVRGETAGAEFGATTGRPRNCGWFDGVIAKFAAREGRVDNVFLTKLDRLSGFPEIKVATAYRYKGDIIKSFPAERLVFEEAEPVYREFPGWPDYIGDARGPGDLPRNTRDYVKRLEDMMERKITHASVGPKAEQTIELI